MSSSDHISHLPVEGPTVHTVAARDGVELAVAVYRPKSHRLRLEIANTDSPLTAPINTHLYPPRAMGEDHVHMGGLHQSRLRLPVLDERA